MGVPDRSGDTITQWVRSEHHMKESQHIEVEEPVGIVISGGRPPETLPRFSAYMWAPGPEDDVIDEVQAA